MSPRDLLHEFRTAVLGKWFGLSALLKDRRAILRSPSLIIEKPAAIQKGPLTFALAALLLPSGVLYGIVTGLQLLIEPPPLPIESALADIEHLDGVLHEYRGILGSPIFPAHLRDPDLEGLSGEELAQRVKNETARLQALKKALPTPEPHIIDAASQQLLLSMAALDRVGRRELDESLRSALTATNHDRALLRAVTKTKALEERFRPLMLAISLLVSSVAFRWLSQRSTNGMHWSSHAHTLYLYITSAQLMPVVFMAALISIIIDYSLRYDVLDDVTGYNILGSLIGLLGLFRLRRAALQMAQLKAPPGTKFARRYRAAANSIVAANTASHLVQLLVFGSIALAYFYLQLRRPL